MNVDWTVSNLIVRLSLLDDGGDFLRGLTANTQGLEACYKLQNTSSWVVVPLVSGSDSVYQPGGFIESHDLGRYYFGVPNEALVAGTTTSIKFELPGNESLEDSITVSGGGSFTGPGYVSNTLKHDDLVQYVSQYLGFSSRIYSQLSSPEKRTVDGILNEGLREFYFQPMHNWSFLQKRATIHLVSGRDWYPMPGDFVRFSSALNVDGGKRIQTVKESEVVLRQNNSPQASTPVYAAIRVLSEDHQGYEIGFYPSPDSAMQVEFSYLRDPGGVSSLSPTPRGGPRHASTIIASCLAAAERLMNPETMAEGGVHQRLFAEKLQASIATDNDVLIGKEFTA